MMCADWEVDDNITSKTADLLVNVAGEALAVVGMICPSELQVKMACVTNTLESVMLMPEFHHMVSQGDGVETMAATSLMLIDELRRKHNDKWEEEDKNKLKALQVKLQDVVVGVLSAPGSGNIHAQGIQSWGSRKSVV